MPNMNFGVSSAPVSQSYLTPRTPVSQGGSLLEDTPENRLRTEQLTNNLFATKYAESTGENPIARVGKLLGAASIDMVDMVGSSVIPGVQRGDYWQAMRADGNNELADFADRNRDGVGMTSGVVGAILTDGLSEAALIPMLTKSLASSTAISGTALYKYGAKFLPAARLAAKDNALKAAVESEMIGVFSTSRQLLGAKVTTGVLHGARSEAAIFATTHTNEQMYSDDWSTNAAWMALGLGIGGVAGALGARAETRALANSDEVTGLRAAATDPNFREWAQLNPVGKQEMIARGRAPAGYKESYNTTALLLQARTEEGGTGLTTRFVSNLNKQAELGAIESFQKQTSRGIPGAAESAINLTKDKEGIAVASHLSSAGHADPTTFLGVDSMGYGDFGTLVDAQRAHADRLMKSTDPELIQEGIKLKEQEPSALIGGSWVGDSKETRIMSKFDAERVDITPHANKPQHYMEYDVHLSPTRKFKIDASANVPGFERASLLDRMKIMDGLVQLGNKMRAARQNYIVPKNPTWLQIDFARDYAAKGGKVDLARSGFRKMDDLEMEGLRQKANHPAVAAAVAKGSPIDHWDRLRLNLALPGSLERLHDGTSRVMSTVLDAVQKNPKMTIHEVKELRTKLMDANGLRSDIKNQSMEVHGDFFKYNRNEKGEWQPIVTGFSSVKDMRPELVGTVDHVVIGLTENKVFTIQKLAKGDLTKKVTAAIASSPELAAAARVSELAGDQVTGLSNGLSRMAGAFVTQAFRFRDSKVMQAAYDLRALVNRLTNEHINEFLNFHFGGIQNELTAVPARGSKALVDQYFSMAGGWDLDKGFVPVGNDMFGFALVNSEANSKRLGRTVRKGELLLNGSTGKPVVVDKLGLEYVSRFESASFKILQDTNAIRDAKGLAPIEWKPHFVPAPNTKGKLVAFTFDVNGKVVPGGGIIASTQDEFDHLVSKRQAELDRLGLRQTIRTKAEVESLSDLFDQAQMGWVDPGFQGRAVKGQEGGLFGWATDVNAMQNSLDWVSEQLHAHANNTVDAMFDSQIKVARARAKTIEAVTGNKGKNIYTEWETTIRGLPSTQLKPSAGTQFVMKAEGFTQTAIDATWPMVRAVGSAQVNQWASDMLNRVGVTGGLRGVHSFEDLQRRLGPHTPFANANQFVEQTMKVSAPPQVRAIANKMNAFAATMMLRWLEIPNAAMNMLGIITNMPSILRSPSTPLMSQMSKNGVKVSVVDSMKILTLAFNDMLHAKSHADWATMVKNGDSGQSMASLWRQLSLVESRGSFARVFLGDPGAKTKAGKMGIDGILSYATDKTENMSRVWSHFVGLRLADMHGIVETEARHTFARKIADSAVADYNPLNRPEAYQSAFGSMVGLFSSYMQSYNQRLFRWMEKGDYASVKRQLMLQTQLFGVDSLPGFNLIDSMMPAGEDDNQTVSDWVYANYGPTVGSIISHGGVQELTKLFGGDTGVALYTRGDANLRAPTLDPTRLAASLNIVGDVANMILEVGSNLINPDDPMSAQFLSETIARNLPNRALKGALEVMSNNGRTVDANGAIVSETKDWLESALRISGLRSTRQQGEIEAYYANTTQRRRMANRLDKLRSETRTLIRSGKEFDAVGLFNKYVERGGQPAHFRTWLKDQMLAATDSRGMINYVKSLKSPSSQLEAWRYETRQ